MKRFTFFMLLVCLIIHSCSTIKQIPVETQTQIHYIDSVRYDVRDSVIIIPVERVKEYVPAVDTLHLETSMAEANAWLDTTNFILNGEIKNKEGQKERIKTIYKDRIEYRDSIVVKEVPVEVEKPVKYVPKIYKASLYYSILMLVALVLFILRKLKVI